MGGKAQDFSSKPPTQSLQGACSALLWPQCQQGQDCPLLSPQGSKGPTQSLGIKNWRSLGLFSPSGFECLGVYSMPSIDVPKDFGHGLELKMGNILSAILLFCQEFCVRDSVLSKGPPSGAGAGRTLGTGQEAQKGNAQRGWEPSPGARLKDLREQQHQELVGTALPSSSIHEDELQEKSAARNPCSHASGQGSQRHKHRRKTGFCPSPFKGDSFGRAEINSAQ